MYFAHSLALFFVGNGGETKCCCTELKMQVRISPSNTFFFTFPEFKRNPMWEANGSREIIANQNIEDSKVNIPTLFLSCFIDGNN